MKTEWKRAHAFAEFAEALGVNTADVLAAWSVIDGGGEPTGVLGVLYGIDDVIYEARLIRHDGDGILRVVGKPEATDLNVADMFRNRS